MPLLWLVCKKLKRGGTSSVLSSTPGVYSFRSSGLAPGSLLQQKHRRRSLRYVLLINVSTSSVPVKILQNKHDREVEFSNLEFNPSRPETVCVSGILTWDLVRMDSLLKHVSRGPFEVLLVPGTSVLASFLQSWRLPLGVNRTEAAGLHPDSVGHQLKTTNSSTF